MNRSAGILLSITSLPSKYGIGCFSQSAYDFVDWLEKAGQKYWQILPLGSTSYGASDDSPYQAFSAFAGNPYFISLEKLIEEGVLTEEKCDSLESGNDPACVDYDLLHKNRFSLLRKAYERSNVMGNGSFIRFIQENNWWLDDYALFMAVREFFGEQHWTTWPEDIRMHWGFAVDYYRRTLYYDIEFHKYMQFKFYEQWSALKKYANDRHIQVIGDMPIYVSPDGADVWAHPEMFQLDENNLPARIAGCPPDEYAEDGQVWGNPLYDWEQHRRTGFQWWVSRMWYNYKLYDIVRLDHFRGFDEYFSIPAGSETAKEGHWEKGPGIELFWRIQDQLGKKGVIAEDLGYMTDTVRQLVKDSGYPNMKVLQFAFEVDDATGSNEYQPHNYGKNCVVYTGTHDNETLVGWLESMKPERKKVIRDYLCDHHTPDSELYLALIPHAMMCAADTCVLPVQDLLGLGNDCRMNQPGTVKKNWRWRLLPGQVTDAHAALMREMTFRYGRVNWDAEDEKAKELAEKKAKAEAIVKENLAE